MTKVKIEYEFDIYEDREYINIINNAHNMYLVICDLDNLMRDVCKHNDTVDEYTIALIEMWRDVLRNSNVLDF